MSYNPYENNQGINPDTKAQAPESESKDEDTTAAQAPQTYEDIYSSSTPQQPAEEPAPQIDYTPDEYYRSHYGDVQPQPESYGDGYYRPQPQQPSAGYNPYAQPQAQQGSGYYAPQYHHSVSQPKPPKKKKEKKPVTRSTLAAVLVASILCSTVLGVGGGFVAATIFANNNSSEAINVSKSDSASASYASSTATLTTTEIVEKSADSVVEITTEQVATGSFSQQYIQQGAGSGVIISGDGYIITNYHVIEGASHITVTLRDKTEYTEVDVIGTYSDGDLALLKVKPKKTLKAATLGDSSKIAVGDYAVVIGNPLGQLGGTVTDGIISALDREVTIDNQTMNLLQTNAEISPGNSGGGLFNGQGELIGIVNAKSSSDSAEGIGFAIPVNDVQDVLSDLKQYGYVKGQIDLGMSLTDISSTAQLWMYGANQTGVYVTSVNAGSNAASSGFRSGDIITKIDGTEVKSTKEVNAIIKKMKVGDTVTFSVYRSGRSGTIKMTLQEYTKDSSTSSNQQYQQNDRDTDDWDPWSIFE